MFWLGAIVGAMVVNVYWFFWTLNHHRKLEQKYGKLSLP